MARNGGESASRNDNISVLALVDANGSTRRYIRYGWLGKRRDVPSFAYEKESFCWISERFFGRIVWEHLPQNVERDLVVSDGQGRVHPYEIGADYQVPE